MLAPTMLRYHRYRLRSTLMSTLSHVKLGGRKVCYEDRPPGGTLLEDYSSYVISPKQPGNITTVNGQTYLGGDTERLVPKSILTTHRPIINNTDNLK